MKFPGQVYCHLLSAHLCITFNTIVRRHAITTTVRIPQRLEQALARYCSETRRSKSEVIIELLENRFAAESPSKTPYELACAAGFVGVLSLDENTAENSGNAVRTAIVHKHGHLSG